MKMLKIDRKEAEYIFKDLSKGYKIIAPLKKMGKGRLSDTDLITYGEIKSFEEIEFFEKTYFSAKEVLFPVRETLFEYQKRRIQEIKNWHLTIREGK